MPTSTTLPRLLLIYGGRSSEHDISVRSAREMLAAADLSKFEVVPLAVARDGVMRLGRPGADLEEVMTRGEVTRALAETRADVVFPLLHGPWGEDGTIQGALELAELPYVGSGVAASAVCMDKIMLKRLAQAVGIPVVEGLDVLAGDVDEDIDGLSDRIVSQVGIPCFVKPANQGSSIGISRVTEASSLRDALLKARAHDPRIVVERALNVEEFEVGVLGSGDARTLVSPPGCLEIPAGQWYDYDNKYVNDVVVTRVPADLPETVQQQLQGWARQIFRAAGCHGLARVDFLRDRDDGCCYLNEVNTMPGFTSISMYPRLMGASGIQYSELVARLCELAIARANTR